MGIIDVLKDPAFWLKVIKYIIDLILGGMSKAGAVAKAAAKFGISEADIWKHGGF